MMSEINGAYQQNNVFDGIQLPRVLQFYNFTTNVVSGATLRFVPFALLPRCFERDPSSRPRRVRRLLQVLQQAARSDLLERLEMCGKQLQRQRGEDRHAAPQEGSMVPASATLRPTAWP